MHRQRAATPLFSFLIVIVSAWGVLAADGTPIDETDTAVRVIDGDTFVGRRLGRVRLADVDAPELGTWGAREATEALAALVHGPSVFLDVDDVYGTDGYGRVVAVVYVEHNATHLRNVNLALVQAGVVRVADFPNEFDPWAWEPYVPRPRGVASTDWDAPELRVASLLLILSPAVVGLIELLRSSRRTGGGGKG